MEDYSVVYVTFKVKYKSKSTEIDPAVAVEIIGNNLNYKFELDDEMVDIVDSSMEWVGESAPIDI